VNLIKYKLSRCVVCLFSPETNLFYRITEDNRSTWDVFW